MVDIESDFLGKHNNVGTLCLLCYCDLQGALSIIFWGHEAMVFLSLVIIQHGSALIATVFLGDESSVSCFEEHKSSLCYK